MAHTNRTNEATYSEKSSFLTAAERHARKIIAGGAVILGATALAACGPKDEVSGTPTPSDIQTEQPTSPTPDSSPTPTGEIDYSLSGAERDAFIKSLEIPADGDATEVGKKIIENLNAWMNAGTNERVYDIYFNDVPADVPIQAFSLQYANDWKDEFATMFDENSDQYSELVESFSLTPAAAMGGYLATFNNSRANAVYTSKEMFVSAEEQAAADNGDRVINVTYHYTDNAADTGIVDDVDGGNSDDKDTLQISLKEYGGILKITDIQAAQ